jgi:hypothetical protein
MKCEASDALKHALGAGALDAHGDAGVFRLERLGDLFRQRQVDRRVVDDLAFVLGGRDQLGRHRGRRRRCRQHAGGRNSKHKRARALQHIATGQPLLHDRPQTLNSLT